MDEKPQRKPVMVRMPPEMVRQIDELRGEDVPREAWIRRVLRDEIKRQVSARDA